MLQSLLTKEYFEQLIPDITNTFVSYNTRDDAKPLITQPYENKVTINEGDIDESVSVCKKKVKEWITATIWKKAFPQSFKEIDYGSCSFGALIDIYEKKNRVILTIHQIKDELAKEYETKYLTNFNDKIVDILQMEGKNMEQVQNGIATFSSLLYDEKYYLTPLDLWILVQKYELPTIFISQQTIMQTGYKENVFVGYDGLDDKFAFIVIPILKADSIPNYKLVQNGDDDIFISVESMLDSSKVKEAILSIMTLPEFLEKDVVVKPKRVRRQLVIASSSTSSIKKSSSSSLDIFVAPGPNTKRRKVVAKNANANAKTKKKK
jgi:ribosomal protein S8